MKVSAVVLWPVGALWSVLLKEPPAILAVLWMHVSVMGRDLDILTEYKISCHYNR